MNALERRYMRSARQPKPRMETKLDRELLSLGIFSMVAVAFFLDTVVERHTIDEFIARAEAAETPKTEAEWERQLCGDLGRYSNGVEFYEYCAGL